MLIQLFQIYSSVRFIYYFTLFILISSIQCKSELSVALWQRTSSSPQNTCQLSRTPSLHHFTANRNSTTPNKIILACTNFETIGRASFWMYFLLFLYFWCKLQLSSSLFKERSSSSVNPIVKINFSQFSFVQKYYEVASSIHLSKHKRNDVTKVHLDSSLFTFILNTKILNELQSTFHINSYLPLATIILQLYKFLFFTEFRNIPKGRRYKLL